ncbi:MAG: YbbR-like domain-containing protein [Thermoanaerobaculia bacterium]
MTKKQTTLWALRALALGLAVAAWVFISSSRKVESETSETTIEPTVQYNNPASEDFIVLDPVLRVQVRLRGPESLISALNPSQVSVVVDLREAELGPTEIPLAPQNVVRPQGLEVLSIEPNLLALEIDRVISEFRPVTPRLAGEPAAGAVVGTPEVVPRRVLVQGPESILATLESLTTRPLLLDGHALDFEEQAVVVSPSPLVQVVQPSIVNVHVPLTIPGQDEDGG